jgi:hypothetical protein
MGNVSVKICRGNQNSAFVFNNYCFFKLGSRGDVWSNPCPFHYTPNETDPAPAM